MDEIECYVLIALTENDPGDAVKGVFATEQRALAEVETLEMDEDSYRIEYWTLVN